MRWYSQAGTPQVTVRSRYDAQARTFALDCEQTLAPTPGQPVKQPMVIPLRIGLVDEDGHDRPLRLIDGSAPENDVLLLAQPAETFVFTDVPARPVLSSNRGFSAPVKLVTDLTPDDLAFLAAHDSDPFNRWQAIQSIAMTLLIDNVAVSRDGRAPRADARLIDALAAVLDDDALEPAFAALALTPPAETDIAREIGRDIDPDAIFRARLHLRSSLGDALQTRLASTYERMAVSGPYSPDATSAGKRSLRNVCLDLLAAGGKADAIARAERQYQAADNMTDRMAALATLAQHAGAARERALDDFYRRYADNALVIDKWFALQAMIPETATLERIRALTGHKAFDVSNPNRIRSLIGAFAQGNPSQFNRADGAGYGFITDHILALDPKNPQVAARLATAFRTWRSLEPDRRRHAEAALTRINARAGLSRDVAEIVERTLAAE
jgi:aminopeptidase N